MKKTLLAVLLLAGCMTQKGIVEEYLRNNPETSQHVAKAMRNRSVVEGMTAQQVMCSWGRPQHRSATGGRLGDSETWFYPLATLHFEGGKLQSWLSHR